MQISELLIETADDRKPTANVANKATAVKKIMPQKLREADLDLSTEAKQLAAVQQDPYAIQHIKDPSEAVQIAAVTALSRTIEYIWEPTETVQMIAVKKNPDALGLIRGTVPSETVQLTAIKESDGTVIRFIEDPSRTVQLAAVGKNGYAVGYIRDPSDEVQLAAVDQSPGAIAVIKDPCEAAQLLAYDKKPKVIQNIRKPHRSLLLISCLRQLVFLAGLEGRVDVDIESASDKRTVIRTMLEAVKMARAYSMYQHASKILGVIKTLRSLGLDWEELDTIENSLIVITK